MAELTAEYVRECLDYDPDTGVFTWRERPVEHFVSAHARSVWNTKHAGGVAGTLEPNGYRRISIACTSYLAHRLAWLHTHGAWPREQIDHINGAGDDNRLMNLREANRSQNMRNASARKSNQFGLKGVSPEGRRFRARIMVERKQIYLGGYDTPEEAHAAYCAAAERHHGEFANGGGSV